MRANNIHPDRIKRKFHNPHFDAAKEIYEQSRI